MARRNHECGGIPVTCGPDALISAVWGSDRLSDPQSELSRLIYDIRHKIERNPDCPKLIISSPGIGYTLRTRPWRSNDCQATFTWGAPILHPRNFFGRRKELRQIRDASFVRPPQHVFVSGPRLAGKTSLLRFLEFLPHSTSEDLNAGFEPDDNIRRIAFIDLHDPRMWQMEGFLHAILARVGLRPVKVLDDFVTALSETPSVTIILDDIEEAASLDSAVWSALRFLGTSRAGSVSIVASSTHSVGALWDQCPQLRPVLRIASHEVPVGAFSEEEAWELINSSPLRFPDGEAQWIIDTSRREPCLLQILCDTFLKHLIDKESGDWKELALARCNVLAAARGSNALPIPIPLAVSPQEPEN